MAAAPFHDVGIHPRTGQETPINIGSLNNFYTTDQIAYDPETDTVAAIERYDSKYGILLKCVPRTGSVRVFDVTEPTSPVEITQTNSIPGPGQFWVSTPGAQSDYGFVNLGFGLVEVHQDYDTHILEVHYQSLATIPSIENINQLVTELVDEAIDGGAVGDAIDAAVNATGRVVQTVYAEVLTSSTFANAQIVLDDSIPQNTEGAEILTLSITPQFSTSKIIIEMIAHIGANAITGSEAITLAAFRDSTANAFATDYAERDVTGFFIYKATLKIMSQVDSVSTSATTFKMRAGLHENATLRVNGSNGGRKLGGSLITSIKLTEVAV